MSKHEICISIRGHEVRLPGLDEAAAKWLAPQIAAVYPMALIEIAHDGIREMAEPAPSEPDPTLSVSGTKGCDAKLPEAFANCSVIVIGDNRSWGKGATLEEARKLAYNPKKWIAFLGKSDTTVSEFDASLGWKVGFAPRRIASCGIKEKK